MVCTANDLRGWKDFPKGLRVLLLDELGSSAAEIKPKLEAMDYNVTTFCSEDEALSAITSRPGNFHLAIVEVNETHSESHFKFLQNAEDMPTIMTSDAHCLNTMMKCIALGAVEFMLKPLSDDKLQNIWQHVVHKAFNSEASGICETLKPVKESVVSMLLLQKDETGKAEVNEMDHQQSTGSDKYPAPSTPQLKQGARLVDDGDCHDHNNCSMEKETGEQDGEGKSADTTCATRGVESSFHGNKPTSKERIRIKEEEHLADAKSENEVSPDSQDSIFNVDVTPSNASIVGDSKGIKANRKKMKVDWTPELHRKFVQAVEQLGVDQAVPSRILELMRVEGLTRHNVASHLQKYRVHKRHILPKEDDRKWLNQRDQKYKSHYPQWPIMAYPHCCSNPTLPAAPVYQLWGQSGSYPAGVQIWGTHGYPLWQPQEGWIWKFPPGMHADAWGCPVLPPTCYPQNAVGFHNNTGVVDYSSSMPEYSYQLDQADEVIDRVVKDAISKPWLPLPLGLRPPSTDSVLTELTKQGFSDIPPLSKEVLPDLIR